MSKQCFALYIVLILFPVSCAEKSTQKTTSRVGTAGQLSYAELFSISTSSNYKTITVFNPWKPGEVYSRYHLVKDNSVAVPADGDKVLIPLKTLMVNSATHLGFLELLNELNKVTGVCNTNYIFNPAIRQDVQSGKITDLGDSFNLDIERLLLLHPQAVMTTAYNADDENSKRMRQTGLTILYNIEWQEKTALGRAEWIKFVGAFFDKSAEADSIFSDISHQYNKIKQQATNIKIKPTVLSGQDFRGSWSMPGGDSFSAHLFNDAGANYFYKDNKSTGSVSTTIEEALIHFNKADIWVNVQANTLNELAEMDAKYKLFKAFKEGNVYNTGKRSTPTGGNDYWEGAVARPDLLLSDLIKIFHPEIVPEYELTYMQQLSK
jgi:ABC-type Fe3+-hydroxamate transport system, periplasmic component